MWDLVILAIAVSPESVAQIANVIVVSGASFQPGLPRNGGIDSGRHVPASAVFSGPGSRLH
jgi:hypothetical protein